MAQIQAQLQKLDSQTFELECCADEFFGFYKNKILQLVKLFPENYKVMERVSALSDTGNLSKMMLLMNWLPKRDSKLWMRKTGPLLTTFLKETCQNYYESFELKLSIIPKGGSGSEGGCLVKWCVEYEKKTEGVPPPMAFIDLMGKITKGTDAHLLKA